MTLNIILILIISKFSYKLISLFIAVIHLAYNIFFKVCFTNCIIKKNSLFNKMVLRPSNLESKIFKVKYEIIKMVSIVFFCAYNKL